MMDNNDAKHGFFNSAPPSSVKAKRIECKKRRKVAVLEPTMGEPLAAERAEFELDMDVRAHHRY